MKITGINDVAKALQALPDEIRRNGEAKTLRAGARPMVKTAKAKVSRESGTLRRAIGANVKKLRGVRTARIGARSGWGREVTVKGQTQYRNPTQYSHLVEYGTAHSAPKPFIRPAVETTQGEVVQEMAKALDKHVTNAVRKLKSRKK